MANDGLKNDENSNAQKSVKRHFLSQKHSYTGRITINPTKSSILQGDHSTGKILTTHLVDRVGIRLFTIPEVYH